jgi:hypothetical protein
MWLFIKERDKDGMEQDHVSSKALNPSALAVKTQTSNLG